MVPSFGTLAAPTPAAVRLIAAVAASLALHAAAGLGLALAPHGSPAGQGHPPSKPLQARIVSPPAVESAPPAAPAPAPPTRAGPAAARDRPAGTGLREGPVYYSPAELDVRPRLRTPVDPVYPPVAPPDGGYLVLRLLIGEDGSVERTIVVLADPEGYFEKAATDAFAAARFAPGRRGGAAVKSQIWIELKFHPVLPPEATPPRTDETR